MSTGKTKMERDSVVSYVCIKCGSQCIEASKKIRSNFAVCFCCRQKANNQCSKRCYECLNK